MRSISDGVPELDQDISVDLKEVSQPSQGVDSINNISEAAEKQEENAKDIPTKMDASKDVAEVRDSSDDTSATFSNDNKEEHHSSGKYAPPEQLSGLDQAVKVSDGDNQSSDAIKSDPDSAADKK